jgi:hypothetical protein
MLHGLCFMLHGLCCMLHGLCLMLHAARCMSPAPFRPARSRLASDWQEHGVQSAALLLYPQLSQGDQSGGKTTRDDLAQVLVRQPHPPGAPARHGGPAQADGSRSAIDARTQPLLWMVMRRSD